MPKIAEIDKNFEVKTSIPKDDIKFYDIEKAPFKIYGVYRKDGKFRRMPEEVAKNVSEIVYLLHTNTSGGRVRFVTDSSYVAISAKLDEVCRAPHMPLTASAGFDLYVSKMHEKTLVPPITMNDSYESLYEFETKEFREITINFPLYSNVMSLYVGLEEDAVIKEASPYVNEKPVVFYGSSITQGGCASRPGMCYPNIISRRFNCDYINLGFSGGAKGEEEMIDYIKGLDMSLFVYDYDHNAPTVKHLEATHEKMFKEIRKENPSLPIVMMSRPKYTLNEDEEKRLEIIKTTYNNAISAGDKNVYFIPGKKLMELCKDEGTVDTVHATDFGFNSMAQALGDVMENINWM